ncbi:MAG: hypothetical protein J5824_02470 [Lachnospiraceae bacterium]|nr:hypothetical protein [Lachnospiraceae bacterium]
MIFRMSKTKIKKLLAGVDAYIKEHYVPEAPASCETASLGQETAVEAQAGAREGDIPGGFLNAGEAMMSAGFPAAGASPFYGISISADAEDILDLTDSCEETDTISGEDISLRSDILSKKTVTPGRPKLSKKDAAPGGPKLSKKNAAPGGPKLSKKDAAPGGPKLSITGAALNGSKLSKKDATSGIPTLLKKDTATGEPKLSKKIIMWGEPEQAKKIETPDEPNLMPDNAASADLGMPIKKVRAAKKTARSLDDLMSNVAQTWQECLFRLIDEKGFSDTEVYKRANIDRKLFSKIRSNPDYQPKKNTAVAFAIALKLSLDEVKDFLSRAGYALSPSSRFDLIISYFVEQEVYDLYTINLALFEHDLPLLE